MGKGPTYNVPYRRRKRGKTNYGLRKRLVASGLPRIVVRRTSKNVTVQLVEPDVKGDRVVTSAHSNELRKKYGYLGSLNNISASYLTGLLCGYRAKANDASTAILDIGLQIPSKGADVFSALKGVLDAGVNVPHDEEVMPDEKRIAGAHIAKYAEQLSADTDEYARLFSAYAKRGLSPQKIEGHFAEVKQKIASDFKKPPKKA